MRLLKLEFALSATAALLFFGCTHAPPPAEIAHHEEAAHGHSHDEDHSLFWQRKDVEHDGYLISLGHHGAHFDAGDAGEPAVMIEKDGQPAADAKVYVTLLDDAGASVITAEQPTIYEPATAAEPAHYAQAEVQVPEGAKMVTVRYRVELPDAG
ncbi:MAG: hypothetical protein KDA41_19430, partial [Planctomycetales bacterium]|nr:hypothetical protein [Planctomycetales bacterium]